MQNVRSKLRRDEPQRTNRRVNAENSTALLRAVLQMLGDGVAMNTAGEGVAPAMFKLRHRCLFLVFRDDLHLELNFGVRIDNSQKPYESVEGKPVEFSATNARYLRPADSGRSLEGNSRTPFFFDRRNDLLGDGASRVIDARSPLLEDFDLIGGRLVGRSAARMAPKPV